MIPLFAQASAPSPVMQAVDSLARTPLSRVVIFMAVCTVLRFLVLPKLMNTPVHLRMGSYPFMKFVNETLDAVVYAGGIVFLVIRPFVIQTFYVPSGSMLDTLQLNDYLVANKWVYRTSSPKAGDIVVFQPPKEALAPGEARKDFIKRLIGEPGQVIEIRNGELYRDGKKVEEKYVTRGKAAFDFKLYKDGDQYMPLSIIMGKANWDPNLTAERYRINFEDEERQNKVMSAAPAAVPEGYYLMMGDNRNGSFDSRGWGLVPKRNIIGRAEFIWLPISRIRSTRN